MSSVWQLHETEALARIAVLGRVSSAGIWFYQGLVPKLLGPHPDELAMAIAFGVPTEMQVPLSCSAGMAEIVFAVLVLVSRTRSWPHLLSACASVMLLAFVAIYAPAYLAAAFNPVSLNLALLALSLITVIAMRTDPGCRA